MSNGTFENKSIGTVQAPTQDQYVIFSTTVDEIIQNLNKAATPIGWKAKLNSNSFGAAFIGVAISTVVAWCIGQVAIKPASITFIITILMGIALLWFEPKTKSEAKCQEHIGICIALLENAKETSPKITNDTAKIAS
jgi:hypothetical protein